MRQLSWGKKLISVMALSFLAQAGFAQTASTGAISGLVTDPSGAVVSEVNVTATNETSGDRRSAVSTSSGRYMVPLLAPGRYRVQATKGGFKELARSGITVYVTETAVANLQLTVGAATEVVNVTSEAELLNVQDSAMGKVTNELVVSSLPLVTRNYTQIIGLSPGVASEVDRKSVV